MPSAESAATAVATAGARGMNIVMILCPQTGSSVSTGIEIDSATFAKLPDTPAQMRCAACGGNHAWTKGQAWVGGGRNGDLKKHPVTGVPDRFLPPPAGS